jgi:hypothetical protein
MRATMTPPLTVLRRAITNSVLYNEPVARG